MRINSNGNVGIGTTSPGANLDIEDASGVTIDINSSSGDGQFRFQDDGVTKWSVGRDNTQQNFVFSNSSGLSSDNVLTLAHSSGNVGIGTTSPSYPLDVTSSSLIGVEVESNYAGSSGIRVKRTGGDSVSLLANYTGYGGGISSTDALRFQVNATNADSIDSPSMYIETNGKVGIGTTSPSRNLDVVGVIQAQGNFYSTVSSSSTNLATANGGQLSLYNGSSTDGNFSNIGGYNSNSLVTSQICFVNESHANRTGAIVFLTHNGGGMPERMRIDSSGNVGIGTTSPLNRLQVSGGSVGIDSEYMIRDNKNNTILLQSPSTAVSNRSLLSGMRLIVMLQYRAVT